MSAAAAAPQPASASAAHAVADPGDRAPYADYSRIRAAYGRAFADSIVGKPRARREHLIAVQAQRLSRHHHGRLIVVNDRTGLVERVVACR